MGRGVTAEDNLRAGRVRNNATVEERLRFYGWVVTDAGCWEWQGGRHTNGYGGLMIRGKSRKVHRLAYEEWVGPIPDDLVIRHRCDNPPCINPEHLMVGTDRDNARDKVERGRQTRNYGERNGLTTLTTAEVFEIRQEYSRGVLTQAMLGEAYGVSRATIGNIVGGKTWTQI